MSNPQIKFTRYDPDSGSTTTVAFEETDLYSMSYYMLRFLRSCTVEGTHVDEVIFRDKELDKDWTARV